MGVTPRRNMPETRALFLLIAWTIAMGASGAPLNPSQDQWTQPAAHLRVPSFNHVDEDICNLECNQGQGACKYTPNNKWIQCSVEGASGECPAHTTKCEPPSPDTYDEGHDFFHLESQFEKMHPGALTPAAGCCNGVASFPATKTSWSECVEWCINANADLNIQNDIEACQFDSSVPFQADNCLAFSKEDGLKEETTSCGQKMQCANLTQYDGTRRALVPDSLLWTDNIVYYEIVPASSSSSWQSNGRSQTTAVNAINRAITEYHTRTNIRFVKRTDKTNPKFITIGYFGGGCSSYVGMVAHYQQFKGNGQQVTLGWCYNSLGSIIHELGHAAGLWHEHTRTDRNTYLKVTSTNGNYAIATRADSRGIMYDFKSIMHYPLGNSMTLTAKGIELLESNGGGQIGQRSGLSALDRAGLAKMYPAAEPEPTAEPTTPAPSAEPTVTPTKTPTNPTRAPTKTPNCAKTWQQCGKSGHPSCCEGSCTCAGSATYKQCKPASANGNVVHRHHHPDQPRHQLKLQQRHQPTQLEHQPTQLTHQVIRQPTHQVIHQLTHRLMHQ